jgi:hypothetical protein
MKSACLRQLVFMPTPCDRVAVLLGATDLVETVVIAHPGSIDFDEMRAIKVRHNSDVTSLGSEHERKGPCFVGMCRGSVFVTVCGHFHARPDVCLD